MLNAQERIAGYSDVDLQILRGRVRVERDRMDRRFHIEIGVVRACEVPYGWRGDTSTRDEAYASAGRSILRWGRLERLKERMDLEAGKRLLLGVSR